jgi:tripartite-type tricarboxylate transporter receptor subunit TctC
MKKGFTIAAAIGVTALVLSLPPHSRASGDYYGGKQIRFIVRFSAGGGYDAYTRTVARYISRHIPGHPATVVENMDGAGSVIAANYIYNKASRDGLTVGVFNAHNIFNHMMGDRSARLDGRKFGWIGTPGKDSVACAIMAFTGLKSFDDIVKAKQPVRMGATRSGNTVHLPEMLNRWAGAKFDIIQGYGGTSKIRLAMRSREVAGGCWTWDSMRSTARAMLDAEGEEKMVPFIINARWKDPEVKDLPLFRDVFKDEKDRRAFDSWNLSNEFSRPFSLPPGSPATALTIMRQAFKATLQDKDFLADLEKANLSSEYVAGEEIERYVEQIYRTPSELKKRLEFTVSRRPTS